MAIRQHLTTRMIAAVTCRRASRPGIILLICLGLVRSEFVRADETRVQQTELPKLIDLKIPSPDEIFRLDDEDKEFDWLVLKSATPEARQVVIVEPLFPRPDTLQKMADETAKLEASRPTTPEERERKTRRLQELRKLSIRLPGNLKDYLIPVDQIDHIIFYEDMMLSNVDALTASGDLTRAYELLLRVENEIPGWEKSKPRFEQLLLTESAARAQKGEIYAALALLEELAQRNINHPELRPRFGDIVRPIVAEAVKAEDFRKARYLLKRVEGIFPDHEIVAELKNQLQQTTNRFLDDAAELYKDRQYAEAASLAKKAETVWTLNGNQRAAMNQFVARYQVLRVGVEDYDGQKRIYPAPLEEHERLAELVEVPLYEPSTADELTYFRSSFFEVWDPTDLGREVVFTLRDTRPHWQSQPLLTANDLAETLGHRINPSSPLFSARLASFVKEISVRSPTELRLRFSRVPLSIESLMRFPVIARPSLSSQEESSGDATTAVEAEDQSEEAPESREPVLLSTRFRQIRSDETGRTYVRSRPEPEGMDASQYHIAEIQEHRFADRGKMLQAMIRGDVDYIPHLLPWEVDAFQTASDYNVVPYALPVTHVIAFNPMSDRIVNAQMRRALSFAVPRESILKAVVLRDDKMRYGRPTSAAWHLKSYATEPNQEPPQFNLRLAYALRYAAERQLQLAELSKLLEAARAEAKKNDTEVDADKFRSETKVDYIKLQRLRFVVDPDPTAIAAAERMMVYWQRIGFEIDLIQGDQSGDPLPDGEWDMCYRRVRMEEPLLELWPLLSGDTSLDMNRLGIFPDWMRQELINLDYASSFLDAQQRLFTIHNHIAAEAFLIPLWEVDDFAVVRKTVTGMPPRPMSTYHNVERWIVRP
jgi:ABC-type transport system substrate-binding protein